MLSQASYFVTPLSLVAPNAPQCAQCNDTGEIPGPCSLFEGLPCSCQNALFNLRVFGEVLARKMVVTMVPVGCVDVDNDDDRFDEVYYSQYQNGYEVGY